MSVLMADDTSGSSPPGQDTNDDHRMAMSLSLVGLRSKGVCIIDPACVRKTFPNYWNTLEDLVEKVNSKASAANLIAEHIIPPLG